MSPQSVRVLEQLEEAKRRGLTVYVDNDHIGAYDEDKDESVLDAMPHEVMEALLEHFGLKHDSV